MSDYEDAKRAATDLQERLMNTMERDWQAMEARADAPFEPAPCNCEQALRLQARVAELESQLKTACVERDSALLLLRKELNAL